MVEALAAFLQPVENARGAVDGGAFFVAGDEQADRAAIAVALGDARDGGDEGGDGALHVGGAAAEQRSAVDRRCEGIEAPGRDVAGRHHVGVAGEAEIGRGRSQPARRGF